MISKLFKIFNLIKKHKIVSVIILLLIVGGIYFGYKKLSNEGDIIQYATAAVERGTIITSVSGSGQVSALNQVDVKSEASGKIVYIGVKNGQEVDSGTLLAQIDSQDAQRTVRDAELAFQQEELDLEKMKGMTTDDGIIRGIREKAEDDIEKAYEDGFNTVANIFLELPDIIMGLNDILFSHDFEMGQWNISYYADTANRYDKRAMDYKEDTYNKYQSAKEDYDQNLENYKLASRYSDSKVIESLIDQTYETVKEIAEAVKSANNLIQFYQEQLSRRGLKPSSVSDTHLSDLSSYTSKTNNYLLNLLSIKNSIQSGREELIDTNFDIDNQEIQVMKAEETLLEAKEKLSDYFIRAPFSGIIAEMNIVKGDSVGSSTVIAILITNQKIAEITLNEIDIAKVRVGQKANITFDAIEDLNLTGKVVEVDTIGSTTQGVVTYDVKISFDTQDERIKPGMSISASIITDIKQDTLLISNSAVKQQGEVFYVEVVDGADVRTDEAAANVSADIISSKLRSQQVQIGLSNETITEIIEGLEEGDMVVTQISGSSQTSLNNERFGPEGGGSFMRIMR